MFLGQTLEEDHSVILEQILEAIKKHKPEALIIAGDIFDRASPPASAVAQFNEFIRCFRDISEAALIAISGNHDSADRIDAYSAWSDANRTLICGPMRSNEKPLILSDEHGPIAFSALPFGSEYAARAAFESMDITSPEGVVSAQVEAARVHVPDNARWVVVVHAFVAGAATSESERKIVVGGIETIPPSTFEDANYVALGHLHRPQTAGGDHIVYSGSPIAFGFDEADAQKSMALVELDAEGGCTVERILFKPKRRIRVLTGLFLDILENAHQLPSDDFIKLVLTDDGALVDPISRIREFYPNTLQLQYARNQKSIGESNGDIGKEKLQAPADVISAFLTDVRDGEPSEEELAFAFEKLTDLQNEEAAT
jgi:exonuclease SbcD